MAGAAWATLAAYAAMAAALWLMGRGLYPVVYEPARVARAAAALLAVAAGAHFLGVDPAASDKLAVRGLLLAAFPFLLALSGFFDAEETAAVKRKLGLG
jgi:hypothetical protein